MLPRNIFGIMSQDRLPISNVLTFPGDVKFLETYKFGSCMYVPCVIMFTASSCSPPDDAEHGNEQSFLLALRWIPVFTGMTQRFSRHPLSFLRRACPHADGDGNPCLGSARCLRRIKLFCFRTEYLSSRSRHLQAFRYCRFQNYQQPLCHFPHQISSRPLIRVHCLSIEISSSPEFLPDCG